MQPFVPSPPFVWPETRVLAGQLAYEHQVPFDGLIRQSPSIVGILRDVDAGTVAWLRDVLSSDQERQCRLIIAVYPACATRQADLEELMRLQDPTNLLASLKFSIMTVRQHVAPANLLVWKQEDSQETYIAFGPTTNDCADNVPGSQANLVFRPDAILLEQLLHWFDYTWMTSLPLTPSTASIPALVPATGSPEAAALWEAYEGRLQALQILEQGNSTQIDVDENTGGVIAFGTDGPPLETPTEELMGQYQPLVTKLSRIYGQGALVTVDKSTRLKPFDAPIAPHWFGLDSFRQVGGVSRRVSYRISPFDERTLKELNNLRKRIGDLLPTFTFPLGDGVRWMPTAARKLFLCELARADETGRKRFAEICGANPEEFVMKQTNQILADATRMYQELFPNQNLSARAQDTIITSLSQRLQDATDSPFMPKVSFTETRFRLENDNDQTSAWGQALTLLHAIAEFPRRCVSDRYFLRGVSVKEDALLVAMNVANDSFVRDRKERGLVGRAERELEKLETIILSEEPDEDKCFAILAMLEYGESSVDEDSFEYH